MKIKKSTLLWIVIVVMLVIVLWMTFNTGSVDVATQATSTASRTAAASYGSGMVGGC